MGFTRKDESEADKLGFDFYTHAGWDPPQFGQFFQDMIDAGYDKTPAIASDHPTLASRVDAVKKWVSELPPQAAQWRKPPVADVAKFHQLQAKAAQLAKTTRSDETLANSQQLLQALPRSCIIPYQTEDEVAARKAIAQKADAAQQTNASGTTSGAKKKHKPAPAPVPAAQTVPPQSQIIGRSG